MQIIPLFAQSWQSGSLAVSLTTLALTRRMYGSGALNIEEFDIWGKRHNGDHVIHVTREWRHGIQHRSNDRYFLLSMAKQPESVCPYMCPDPEVYIQWICNFWIPRVARGGSHLFCTVSVVIWSWLIRSFWQGSEFATLNLDGGDIFWIEVSFTIPGLLPVIHCQFIFLAICTDVFWVTAPF